jgi:hypothetical protein
MLMPAVEQITSTTPMTLVVAWRTGTHVHARRIKIAGAVHAAFVEYANAAAQTMNEPGGRDYDPDDEQDDAPYVRATRGDAWDMELLSELAQGVNLDEASNDDLKHRFVCYALTVGPSESPTLYVRKTSPLSLGTKPLVARFLDGAVSEISEPLFAFDSVFDVIITAETVYALNQKRFEALFKDSDAVLARADEWVQQLSSAFPLADGSAGFLTDTVKRNSIFRRKLTSILKREYLQTLTVDVLREKIREHGLDDEALLVDDKLSFTAETARELFWVLNQDIYSGDFSGETFAAGSKRRI